MDEIKEEFQKINQDIKSLYNELENIKKFISKQKFDILKLDSFLKEFNHHIVPTDKSIDLVNREFLPTQNIDFKALKPEFLHISIGNEGVPTDKQTNRQTDRQMKKESFLSKNSFEKAIGAIDSLDNIKKEIRLKFKRLTKMELLVFSTIYQLEENLLLVDYRSLSKKLNLSESSIRDYIGKLIKKGIPIDKLKINNKSIQIKISENLKKIVTLNTILNLRDL